MKRLFLIIWLGLSLAHSSFAQGGPPGQPQLGPANFSGLLYASNFGQWQVPQGNTGQFSWSVPSFCTVSASGLVLSPVFAVGTPITIKDNTPSNTEIVTPTAVRVSGSGCSITVTTVNPHSNFTIQSATAGLQEAINFAQGMAYQVILTPDWGRLGGTTAMILAAHGSPNVTIVDQRTVPIDSYKWDGPTSEYVLLTTPGGNGNVIPSTQYDLGFYPLGGTQPTIQGHPDVTTDLAGDLTANSYTAGAGNTNCGSLTGCVGASYAVAAVYDKGGQVYNIQAYGAQSCSGATPFDSTAAIQAAIDASGGSPVIFPAGKWCISAPLMYYTRPPTNGTYSRGPIFQGAGHGKTQLLMLSSFTVPTSVTFQGATAYPAPSMIDVQGVITAADAPHFQMDGRIEGFEMTPYGCETNPTASEPGCAYVAAPAWTWNIYNGISAISVEGSWKVAILSNTIKYMSGDGIIMPSRLDLSSNGDLTGGDGIRIDGDYIQFNKGWGANLHGSQTTFGGDLSNIVTYNSLGGVRWTGAPTNTMYNNSIALNGCGQPVSLANAVSELNGTSFASQATCSSNPLGPGVWIGRGDGPGAAGPYNYIIAKTAFDSNAAASIIMSNVTNVNTWSNTNFVHTSGGYTFNTSWPGPTPYAPHVQYVDGTTAGINITHTNDYFRGDFFADAAYPTASSDDLPNASLDPTNSFVDLSYPNHTAVQAMQNEALHVSSFGNYTAYAQGAGAIFGAPTFSSLGGGQVAIASFPLSHQGYGYLAAPGITIVGGDAAWLKPTLVTLTQTNGVLNVPSGCTITQAGGPYTYPPLTSVQDTQGGTGSGGAFTVHLTAGVPDSCTVTSGGSGYSTKVIGGVAPTCLTHPVATATATLGIRNTRITTAGNYGAWTPGSTPPGGVTATFVDSTGSGAACTPVLTPTNIGSISVPNVVWGVMRCTIRDNEHGSNYSFSPTMTYNCVGGCVTPATGTAQVDGMLAPTLTVSNAGSCDANTQVWAVATNPQIPATTPGGDYIRDQGDIITQPSGPTFADQLTLDTVHKDLNLLRVSGLLATYCGVLVNGLPTAACTTRVYKSDDGTNKQYFEINTTGTGDTLLNHGAGALAAQSMTLGTGDGTNGVQIEVGGTVQWNWDSSGDFLPNTANTTGTLGTTAKPIPGIYIGTQGSGTGRITGTFTAARVFTLQDATGTFAFTSQLTPIRSGTWSISSATSVAVTFSSAMGSTPTSCSVTPSASAATTGTPFATALGTTGFTVNVPTSGTLAGTYQCVIDNAN
jgi:hypothetical protein